MNFSKLSLLRIKKGLSQRELAKIIGVAKSTYARWETQEDIIPLWHIVKYCNYFKVSIDYLLGVSDYNTYSNYDYTRTIDKKIIGNNIKYLRKQHNLTQRDLALLLNTSQSTICAYESGKTLILTAFAYALSKTFNESIDDICGLNKKGVNIQS